MIRSWKLKRGGIKVTFGSFQFAKFSFELLAETLGFFYHEVFASKLVVVSIIAYSGMFVHVIVIEHLSHPPDIAPIDIPIGAFFGDVGPTLSTSMMVLVNPHQNLDLSLFSKITAGELRS